MESDVGAGVSIISQETYNRHSKETPLQPSNTCLQTYTRHCVKIFGQFLVQFKYQNHNVTVPLLVVKGLRPSLFGRNWLSRIKLDWKPICSIRVSGAGLPHDVKTIAHLNPVSRWRNHSQIGEETWCWTKVLQGSPVPYALQEANEAEYHQLESKGIMEKVQFS